MIIRQISLEDGKTAKWSGGTTTELYIYPENSVYANRDFVFRISSATVESDKSVFTKLPGVQRWIAPLNGSFTLTHQGHHKIILEKHQVDRFEGDWDTECQGRARDFNLMVRAPYEGKMALSEPEGRLIHQTSRHAFYFFYALEASECTVGDRIVSLKKDTLLMLEFGSSDPELWISRQQRMLAGSIKI